MAALLVAALSVGTTVATGTGAVTTVTHVQTGPSIPPPRTAADARREARAAAARPRSDRLAWPLRGEVTGRFGEQRGGHRHAGVDIPMPEGTPIRAASGGTVVMREEEAGYGKYTCIRHTAVISCYAHQSRFRTKLGATVERGQVIGYVGGTGTAETTHLHFEVRRGRRPWGKPLNPMRYLPS